LPTATRTLIRDLDPNQYVQGVYAIHNCQLGQTRTGKPFIKCLIGDRSGKTPGRMWNASEELFSILPTDGFVRIEGQSQPYQGEVQIIIQQIEPVTPSDADLQELLPSTDRDIDQMFVELKAELGYIKHPALKALAEAYLADDQMMQRFKRAPAAMSLHHAYIGGLLEHTLNLMHLAAVICPLYDPKINPDLVSFGLFVHDLGKCAELTWERGFNYTDDGQLVGHIARGVLWLQKKADECEAAGTPIPEPILRVLHHIILSHHGRHEFGALKIPATPEAIAVSLIDNLDAKMNMAIAAGRGESVKADAVAGNFTEKIWALETRIYRPDPTTLEDDADDV